MIQRIQKIIRYKNLTSSRFADKIGVPRSTISHILSERNKPSLEVIQKILDAFPDLQTQWLVRGEGQMVKGEHTLFPEEDFNDTEQDTMHYKTQQEKPVDEKDEFSSISSQENKNDDTETSSREILKGEEGISRTKEMERTSQSRETAEKKETPATARQGKIVRVLLFYDNGRFKEYFPEKE